MDSKKQNKTEHLCRRWTSWANVSTLLDIEWLASDWIIFHSCFNRGVAKIIGKSEMNVAVQTQQLDIQVADGQAILVAI